MQTLSLQAVVFRSVRLIRYTPDDKLSGIGAAAHGGHWNPKGVRAVYCGLTPEIALKEALQAQTEFGLDSLQNFPQVVFPVQVLLHRVLDLRDPSNQAKYHIDLEKLLHEQWRKKQHGDPPQIPKCHEVTANILANGWEAVLIPSRLDPSQTNLVIYLDRLLPESILREPNQGIS